MGVTVIREQNGARLVRLDDDSTRCECPFACMAACEPCEFMPWFNVR